MKNTSIFLSFFGIILLLIATPYLQSVTGDVIAQKPTISIYPAIVNEGQVISIKVDPQGADQKVELFQQSNNLKKGELTLCTTSKCYSKVTLAYRIPQDLTNKVETYYLKLKDRKGNEIARTPFTVIPNKNL